MKHYSVLKDEAIESLNLNDDSIVIDATLGYAGHSSEILKRIKRGMLFAFDQDQEAIQFSEEKLSSISNNFKIFHSNFERMEEYIEEPVDAILFDLGVSSPQIDDTKRGFSFMRDEILDMRMDQTQEFHARTIVNTYSEEELTNIFFLYGEERFSKNIARKICSAREEKEIVTTQELVEIIKNAVGANYFFKQHPERNIFQAIRIEVNHELDVIKVALESAINLLKPNGRIAVITFHSLEDRLVKNIFKKYSSVDEMVKGLPEIPLMYQPKLKLITRKPIIASEEELKLNSRSRSAKLRVVERVSYEKEN